MLTEFIRSLRVLPTARKADRVNDGDSIHARACAQTGSRCERAITGPRESFNFSANLGGRSGGIIAINSLVASLPNFTLRAAIDLSAAGRRSSIDLRVIARENSALRVSGTYNAFA